MSRIASLFIIQEGGTSRESLRLGYSTTQTTLPLSSLGWGSSISLQAAVEDVTGQQTEKLPVFTEEIRSRYFSPLKETEVGLEGAEDLILSWSNPNTALDSGDLVPLLLRLYHLSRKVREYKITESESGRFKIPYRELQCEPWELAYSLGLEGEEEGRVLGLLDHLPLLPPHNISLECWEECELSWCLPDSQPLLPGLGTILTFWNSSSSGWEAERLERTDRCDNLTFLLPLASHLSLQSYIPGYKSSLHSDRVQLAAPVSSLFTGDRLWLILGLGLLLLLVTLGTALCLRRVRRRGGYDIVKRVPASQQRENFLVNTPSPPPQSDSGSRDTEQSSISDTTGIMARTGSVITLGNFNEDDEFMGHFDEDGSFIGDYTRYNKEESQAVQNQQLVFANMMYKDVY